MKNGSIIQLVNPYEKKIAWRVWTDWGEEALPDDFLILAPAHQTTLVEEAIAAARRRYETGA